MFRTLFVALFAGLMLVFSGNATADCHAVDPLCDTLQHPKARDLKPQPCVPIRFDQWKEGDVAIEVLHPKKKPRRLSSHFGTTGGYCFGEHWLKGATLVRICNDLYEFKWEGKQVADALARAKKIRGLDGTLKGTEHYQKHKVSG